VWPCEEGAGDSRDGVTGARAGRSGHVGGRHRSRWASAAGPSAPCLSSAGRFAQDQGRRPSSPHRNGMVTRYRRTLACVSSDALLGVVAFLGACLSASSD
jgi:hypothetical protein